MGCTWHICTRQITAISAISTTPHRNTKAASVDKACKQGKPDDTLWTSEEQRRAVEDYNEACEGAATAMTAALQGLCDKLLVRSHM